MGGLASGRHRTRNRGSVEQACRIDLRFLRKQGALKDGCRTSGTLRWNRGGEPCGSMGYTVVMDGEDRRLILAYTANGEAHSVTVQIVALPMRFGGVRYYALCPRTLRRCQILPVVGGVVACRQAHRLSYASQSLDRLGRLREKAERCEKQLRKRSRRGANKKRLCEAWIDADMAFHRELSEEALRRFGCLF